MSLALHRCAFPRGLALRLPGVPLSPNLPRTLLSARYHPPPALGPVNTKRRRHLIVPAALALDAHPTLQFHINFVLIVLPHRLGNLHNISLDSVGSCRRRGSPLPGTRHSETRRRRRGRRKKFVPAQRTISNVTPAPSLIWVSRTTISVRTLFPKPVVPFRNSNHYKRSSTQLSILGLLLLGSNRPVQMRIPVRSLVSYFDCLCSTALFRVQTWRAHT
jgi:hypothetical protein